MDRPEFRLSILALIVAVATGAFTYLQYRVADRSRQEMHDDSMQNLKLSSRPYVAVKATLNSTKKVGLGKEKEITLQFSVSGNSPAIDMEFRRGCQTFPHFEILRGKPPAELSGQLKTALPHGVLFSGQTMSLHCVIQGDEVSGVMFVEGDVTYADVFRQRHKTGFCFYILEGAKDKEGMYPCTEGNTME